MQNFIRISIDLANEKLENDRQQVKGRQLVGTAMDGRNGTASVCYFYPEEVQETTSHETRSRMKI